MWWFLLILFLVNGDYIEKEDIYYRHFYRNWTNILFTNYKELIRESQFEKQIFEPMYLYNQFNLAMEKGTESEKREIYFKFLNNPVGMELARKIERYKKVIPIESSKDNFVESFLALRKILD